MFGHPRGQIQSPNDEVEEFESATLSSKLSEVLRLGHPWLAGKQDGMQTPPH